MSIETINTSAKNHPFKGELIENEFEIDLKRLKQLKNNPDVVIKIEGTKNYYNGRSGKGISIEEKRLYHKQAREILNNLREKYNLNIPPFSFVAGHSEEDGKAVFYTVTEKIKGKKLDDALVDFTEKEFKELEQLLLSLIAYVRDIYEKGYI